MLEALIDKFAKLGQIRLSRTADGAWYAALELPTPDGVTAKVASRFDHLTHTDALMCLDERLANLRTSLVEKGGEQIENKAHLK